MIPAQFYDLQSGVNRCLKMLNTCETQDHLDVTSVYISLFINLWEHKIGKLRDDDLSIALDAATDVLIEALHDRNHASRDKG